MQRKLFVCAVVIAISILTSVAAYADSVTVGITTTGCFSGPSCQYPGDQPGTLTFIGIVNKPDVTLTTPPDQTVTLGTFRLGDNGQSGIISGVTFTATITFNAPPGAGGQFVTAQLIGQVVQNEFGVLALDFDNTPMLITFTNGSFLFSVNDLILGVANENTSPEWVEANWTGVISDIKYTPPVPEPASLTLLGTGILGFAGFLRRKFRG